MATAPARSKPETSGPARPQIVELEASRFLPAFVPSLEDSSRYSLDDFALLEIPQVIARFRFEAL